MEILNYLEIIFSIPVLTAIVLGSISGVIIGGMPGLTATMAVALLIPITFNFEPIIGLALMGGVYCGAMYGGSIPAILLATPGTPAAAATVIEGYPLTRQGKGGLALKVSVVSSFIGGTFSIFILLLVSPLLARVALKFGPAEQFLLAIMGLMGIVSLTSGNLIKGLMSGLLGLVIALIGEDPMTGMARYTGGFLEFNEGISFMPALIGMFSITSMLELTGQHRIANKEVDLSTIKREPMPKGLKPFIFIGSIVGTAVGILPGEGATVAAFLSYNFAKQKSKFKKLFGKGNVEGIAAAESGNNACVGGSLVPLLTLGIPGNTVSAALMGGLLIHGLIPGPELFTTHAEITYSFILSLFVANVVFLIIGILFAPYFAKVSLIPSAILIPTISMFSIIGSYSMNNSILDVWLMLIFALVGFILSKAKFSLSAIILGMILGNIAENGFSQAMAISAGKFTIFFASPISWVLWIIIFALLTPAIIRKKGKENIEDVAS